MLGDISTFLLFLLSCPYNGHLYGLKKIAVVNLARNEIFNKTYKVADIAQSFSLNVRNYDACNLPPCQSELRQHLLRTKYIVCLWRNAQFRIISDMSPTDFGWKNVEGKLEMNWFIGNQLPDVYEDIVISPDILGETPDSDTQNFDENDSSDLNAQYEEESSDEED
ncbi:uncharacterized protein LOC126265573 [Aethina tumida]|uniref:uncharacterized protein LOC126265573 n=1 Tax=Aethina tumida TaxID=116153 RepID=UPI0021477E6E|nr:uncharacterized protein LOC126265573 [Aethina tumida]